MPMTTNPSRIAVGRGPEQGVWGWIGNGSVDGDEVSGAWSSVEGGDLCEARVMSVTW